MNQSVLKKIRVVFSILYFLLITVVFIDFTGLIPAHLYKSIVFLQFFPSFLKFKTTLALSSAGFIIILILTLFYGRVYCSFICPLGFLQDIISLLSKKVRRIKNYRYRYLKSFKIIRYSFLSVFIIALLFGYTIILSLLEPYSIYGRIASGIFRKSVVEINNLIVSFLQKVDIYSLFHVDLKTEHWTVLLVSIFFIVLIILFSALRGRLYCNTVCPVGAILGLISRFSVFKLKMEKTACTGCNLCVRVCKAGCIDCDNQQIDFERCVACYNCVSVCRESGIGYKNIWIAAKHENKTPDELKNGRRQFFAISALILIAGVKKIKAQQVVKDTATKPTGRSIPVSPPGSVSVDKFNSACTACRLCISACPTHVLQPSYTDYGLIGFMQPVMDYHTGFCNFECIKCSEVCPTGAIRPIELETKKLTQLGIAHFVRRNCIVRTEKTDCGACAEHCPTKAVTMVPWRHGLVIPEVTPEICIGCGACEYACPTTPYKAIYVEGNAVHEIANQPDKEKQEVKVEDDFPF